MKGRLLIIRPQYRHKPDHPGQTRMRIPPAHPHNQRLCCLALNCCPSSFTNNCSAKVNLFYDLKLDKLYSLWDFTYYSPHLKHYFSHPTLDSSFSLLLSPFFSLLITSHFGLQLICHFLQKVFFHPPRPALHTPPATQV